ncbi:hypothetical protein Tco_0469250 [Tanacetum coccineum]
MNQYPEVPVTDITLRQPPTEKMETYSFVNDDKKKKIDAEAEVVHIILTGVDNDIYSAVYACANAKEMWIAIELNKLARHANPLAHIVATQQPSYYPQLKPNYNPLMSSTRSQAATRSKGKEIARAPSPPPESKHEVVSDEEDTPRDKEIAKLIALISTSFKKIYKPTNNNPRISSNTRKHEYEGTGLVVDKEPLEQCDSNTTPYLSDMRIMEERLTRMNKSFRNNML